ncbi:MalM family protein [Vibrio hippocampi]|uniref:Transcriptional regulator n=1 Tax=Vibrio hippocampi TaxID=654686 RepID=A0ABM8ZIJ6_9VIBR|nr:MalM family protein [Vibrio hippocampi]CAH0526655.1 hypothetical protein VHP8226_02025 [Vibrio hippocampi]
MYFRALMLGGCVALSGCQSTEVIEQTQVAQAQQANNVSQLQSIKMTLPSSAIVDITEQSQRFKYQHIDSPVAVFELPANRGEFAISITSLIEQTAFVPRAVIIDKNNQEIERIEKADFAYQKPRLSKGNRLVAEREFFPPVGLDSVYLVVYTDKADLAGSTDVIHPARLDAEARGNYFPEAQDLSIPNANTGTIEVSLDSVSLFSIGSSTNQTAAPQAATIGAATAVKAVESVQPDTQVYYHNAIREAVESNNIPKALSLLDEAKALGVEGAQEVFVQAVNSK